MTETTAPLNLTYGRLRNQITAIVEQTFPVPRGENCLPVSEMERALTDYVSELVQAVYAEEGARNEVERYQREAHDAAADSGRRLKLLAQAYAALVEFGAKCLWHHDLTPIDGCGACESAAIVGAAVAAIKEEAGRSPWLAERINETQEVSRD